MITSSTWLYTIIKSTTTLGIAPGVDGQEMKLNPEKWLAERAARSWTAGIGKRNDLRGKLRSTPRRHCIGTRLDFLFIWSTSWKLWSWWWWLWGSLLVVIRIQTLNTYIHIVELPVYFFIPSAKPHHETFPPASQQTSPIYSILPVKDGLGRHSASNMISLFVNMEEILFLVGWRLWKWMLSLL